VLIRKQVIGNQVFVLFGNLLKCLTKVLPFLMPNHSLKSPIIKKSRAISIGFYRQFP